MPITRSATRSATVVAPGNGTIDTEENIVDVTENTGKRKRTSAPKAPAKRTKSASAKTPAQAAPAAAAPPTQPVQTGNSETEELVPAVLTFSFEDAKRHLISVDPRFEDVFRRVKCKPYEHLERVDPFRTLAHSILGQQISWKAAAAITHKFRRLFDPSLPETLSEYEGDFFPTAHQVVTKDVATLRSAGLSARKAEYILDLASRFADGRLSTRKLLEADDEELHRMLIEVRGIGTWTVNMFAMFSLRRPDILPVGDLGVQRGLLRWFVALHAPAYPVSLRKDKLTDQGADDSPVSGTPKLLEEARATTPDASSVPPVPDTLLPSTPKKKGKGQASDGTAAAAETSMGLPEPFTPSINRTLNMLGKPGEGSGTEVKVPPLPEGLTVAQMKTRLNGKNKIKGALLTPKEMEALTDCWRPYRSLGVYYMWALAEEPK
ncbi:DNA glycosylase [Polyporus arcularius HHB13444]|uniref:DNA glycosylase n=1 Tax=Polyporus arcularius HHB13444 TaxID=1314778 RepID=A0A5C3PJN7_9APHY|nr:DNA glycosylase [Polyporus arcularius HHB13444]